MGGLEKKQEQELMEKPEYKKILIKLDPYLELEKKGNHYKIQIENYIKK